MVRRRSLQWPDVDTVAGPRWNKPRRGILPNGRSKPKVQPYASIMSAVLASSAYRALSPNAKTLHLLLEAAYSPTKLILPDAQAMKLMKCGDATVVKARQELVSAGFLTKLKDAIRPKSMGSATRDGRAAEYLLPHRVQGVQLHTLPWHKASDPHPAGSWRFYPESVRSLVRALSRPAIAILTAFHAVGHEANGAIAMNEPRPITPGQIGLSEGTCRRAIAELLKLGVLIESGPGAGRRAATFIVAEKFARGEVVRRSKKAM